ncbi:hypothetical protein [Parendozoicomonas haliclonae]|uniref:Uncharacterized protein n=1 Tax=Parendozoicomonas haliclonae TaxID=1960125 RepID=A0A1X7AKF1_9GAMM|nr:hypothetical protein [Parendozoicomonas haliclonae]SMA47709.1 hypothetical protein EHSB41UT_02516 [Parendozoicomonas haliclonae]
MSIKAFTPALFTSAFLIALLLCNAVYADSSQSGMNDWTNNSEIQLLQGSGRNFDLATLPEWMPAYMVRNMSIPRPPLPNAVTDIAGAETMAALKAVGIAAGSSLLYPLLRSFHWDEKGYDNLLTHQSLRGTLWHLLAAGNLQQITESENLQDTLFRALVLTNFSPWLANRLPDNLLGYLLASLPAYSHTLFKTLTDPNLQLLPDNQHILPIAFENQTLSRQGRVTLIYNTSHTGRDSVIDIELFPQSRIVDDSVEETAATRAWLTLFDQARLRKIYRLRLYPVSDDITTRLYLQSFTEQGSGSHTLVASYLHNDQPINWWHSDLSDSNDLAINTLNPLSHQIIQRLPDYLPEALANRETPIQPPLLLHSSRSVVSDTLATINSPGEQPGLLLLDWQDQSLHPTLPRISLITDVEPITVQLNYLRAMTNSQPAQLNYRTQELYKLGHQAVWWLAAGLMNAASRSVGERFYRAARMQMPAVHFRNTYNAYYSDTGT